MIVDLLTSGGIGEAILLQSDKWCLLPLELAAIIMIAVGFNFFISFFTSVFRVILPLLLLLILLIWVLHQFSTRSQCLRKNILRNVFLETWWFKLFLFINAEVSRAFATANRLTGFSKGDIEAFADQNYEEKCKDKTSNHCKRYYNTNDGTCPSRF